MLIIYLYRSMFTSLGSSLHVYGLMLLFIYSFSMVSMILLNNRAGIAPIFIAVFFVFLVYIAKLPACFD